MHSYLLKEVSPGPLELLQAGLVAPGAAVILGSHFTITLGFRASLCIKVLVTVLPCIGYSVFPCSMPSSFLVCLIVCLFIYLFMAVLGLRFYVRAFSSCGKWGPLLIAVCGPLTIAASLVAEHRLQTRRLSNCGSRA